MKLQYTLSRIQYGRYVESAFFGNFYPATLHEAHTGIWESVRTAHCLGYQRVLLDWSRTNIYPGIFNLYEITMLLSRKFSRENFRLVSLIPYKGVSPEYAKKTSGNNEIEIRRFYKRENAVHWLIQNLWGMENTDTFY